MKIQINEQRKKFVDEVSTEQRVTLVYHSQSNGLCERQNRSVKKFYLCVGLANILQQNFRHFSLCIIESLLYQSMSSIYILFDIEGNKSEHPFGKDTFDTVFTNAICIRANIHQIAGESICSV